MTDLRNMELAPWVQKATALIERHRKVGGNQFRHCLATMTILMDYHFIDSVILKTAIVHDLLEDSTRVSRDELRVIDQDGPVVVNHVIELTYDKALQVKSKYLENLLKNGSPKSLIVKLADRISNLTDLHLFVFKEENAKAYIQETEKYILPMVATLQKSSIPDHQKQMVLEMGKELKDLVMIRKLYVTEFDNFKSIRQKIKDKLKSISKKIWDEE